MFIEPIYIHPICSPDRKRKKARERRLFEMAGGGPISCCSLLCRVAPHVVSQLGDDEHP